MDTHDKRNTSVDKNLDDTYNQVPDFSSVIDSLTQVLSKLTSSPGDAILHKLFVKGIHRKTEGKGGHRTIRKIDL